MGRQKPVLALVAVAAAISLLASAGAASAKTRDLAPHAFRPRIGFAMGILPKLGTLPEITSGTNWPVVYHGGDVMRNVTLHTIFWAPPGYHFDGSPSPGTLGYEALIKQFLSDVAHDSGAPNNLYSTLTQYHDASGPGSTNISYNPAVDSIDLTAPYPPQSEQCASPDGIATCITDLQLQTEIDQLIGPNDPGARGLSNIWYVFLPPDVDTCTQPGQCATTVFAGYHSEFDLGNGPTVYVPVPDPLVEFTPPPGSDPEGNPEAETTIDTVAHETEESITDPYGTAWVDPNGLEVADKCEDGPQEGTPLGYAPDGSPYNQLDQRPRVPGAGHVVKRCQRLRPKLDCDRLGAAVAHRRPASVQLIRQRRHRRPRPAGSRNHRCCATRRSSRALKPARAPTAAGDRSSCAPTAARRTRSATTAKASRSCTSATTPRSRT